MRPTWCKRYQGDRDDREETVGDHDRTASSAWGGLAGPCLVDWPGRRLQAGRTVPREPDPVCAASAASALALVVRCTGIQRVSMMKPRIATGSRMKNVVRAIRGLVDVQIENPDDEAGDGKQDVAEDHWRAQAAGGTAAFAPVVLDQPYGEQVETEGRGSEPGGQRDDLTISSSL